MLGGVLVWGIAFILLTGTFYIVLSDIGWLDAWNLYGADYRQLFLMARASGQPNGAHLPSYISICFLGFYMAWKHRKGVFLDTYQGILVVAFAVGVHEALWLVAYFAEYYIALGLAVGANFIEDFFFLVMCAMLIGGFWKSSLRTIRLKIFVWPIIVYSGFLFVWFSIGLPISTVNNWQVGQGVYGVTKWFSDPFVNGIEISSWLLIAASFLVVIRNDPT